MAEAGGNRPAKLVLAHGDFRYPSFTRWRQARALPGREKGIATWPHRLRSFFFEERGTADVLSCTRLIRPFIILGGAALICASVFTAGLLPSFAYLSGGVFCFIESRVLGNVIAANDRATPEERARAARLLSEVSKEMGIEGLIPLTLAFKGFRTYFYAIGKRRPLLNAGAVRLGSKGFVLITTDIMKTMTDEQMRGVLAHELAHVKNRDSERRLLLLPVQAAIGSYRRYLLYACVVASASFNVAAFAAASAGVTLARLARMRYQSHREAIADRDAVLLTPHGEGLAQALEILGNQAAEKPTLRSAVRSGLRRSGVRLHLVSRPAVKVLGQDAAEELPARPRPLSEPSRMARITSFLVPPHNSHPVTYDRVRDIRALDASSHRPERAVA